VSASHCSTAAKSAERERGGTDGYRKHAPRYADTLPPDAGVAADDGAAPAGADDGGEAAGAELDAPPPTVEPPPTRSSAVVRADCLRG